MIRNILLRNITIKKALEEVEALKRAGYSIPNYSNVKPIKENKSDWFIAVKGKSNDK